MQLCMEYIRKVKASKTKPLTGPELFNAIAEEAHADTLAEQQEELRRKQWAAENSISREEGPYMFKKLWRATDFWRAACKRTILMDIRKYLHSCSWRGKNGTIPNWETINEAYKNKNLPADFFIDVREWLWFVKEDGYLVALIRDETTKKWSMKTRPGNDMMPPEDFLTGLEKNQELPSIMIGELITDFTACESNARGDTSKRTVLRNQQFAKLNKVMPKAPNPQPQDPDNWKGLRVKVFAFPNKHMDILNTYDYYQRVMGKTMNHHPHIGMCKAGVLQSTADAIQIFNIVVQMGLEGIVIVNPHVMYGTEQTTPGERKIMFRSEDGAQRGGGENQGTFFKLKQKIVLPSIQVVKGHQTNVDKDGEKKEEWEYTANVAGENVRFTDEQGWHTGSADLKYMERAEKGTPWPCKDGYRHMHFSTEYDMSVQVPAELKLIEEMLAVKDDAPGQKFFSIRDMLEAVGKKILDWQDDEDRNKLLILIREVLGVVGDKILNWQDDEDRKKLLGLSPSDQLFNPRPFGLEPSAKFDTVELTGLIPQNSYIIRRMFIAQNPYVLSTSSWCL